MDTVCNSITIHRGFYEGCSFCLIVVHQRITVVFKSEDSVLREASVLRSGWGSTE